MTIKDLASVTGDGPGSILLQTGVRPGRITFEAFDGDTAKVHLDTIAALAVALALVNAVADDIRNPDGYMLAAPPS
jgi:hypothetical protein